VAAPSAVCFETLDVREQENWQRSAEAVPVANVVVNSSCVTGFEGRMVAHDSPTPAYRLRAVYRIDLDRTFRGCRYANGAMKGVREGIDHQHLRALGAGRHRRRGGLFFVEGGDPQPQQDGRALSRAPGWRIRCNTIHPDADLGAMLGDGSRCLVPASGGSGLR
jgi:3(or 17)beta-hydroxysteroid dehydrogenase